MARVPIEEGFFRIPDDPAEPPRLLGSRCPACGEVFFPRRLVCAKCLHEGTEDMELSTQGAIHTWTYCHVPLFGKKDADVAGYGVAQVDLPEGPRVQSILSGEPRRLRHRHGRSDRPRDAAPELRRGRRRDLPLPPGATPRRRRGAVMKQGLRFDGVAVAGIGMVRFGMFRDIPGAHLARDAGLLALHDAGLTLADVDEAYVGYIQPASMLGIKAMKELGLTGLPVTHIENASATGLVAFREAAWAVSSGRADVAMALCFDKFTDMTGDRRPWRRAGPDRRADPPRRLLRPLGPAAHARPGHDARALRHHRGQELELRRRLPVRPPPFRPRGHGRGGPGRPAGGRAADHHDVLPTRRRGRLHHRGPRGPGPPAPARSAARPGPGLGLDVGDLLAGPHLRRPGRRPLHHDPGHGARSTRRPGSVPKT